MKYATYAEFKDAIRELGTSNKAWGAPFMSVSDGKKKDDRKNPAWPDVLFHDHGLDCLESLVEEAEAWINMDDEDSYALTLALNANDYFYRACCDATYVPPEDVFEVYHIWKHLGHGGLNAWQCLKRAEWPLTDYLSDELLAAFDAVPDCLAEMESVANATGDMWITR